MATVPALGQTSTTTNISPARTANRQLSSEANGVRYGIYTAVPMVAYTAIAAFSGFLGRIEAGSLNVVITMIGVVLAIRHLKAVKGKEMGYLQGYGTGIITALVASVILGASFWLLGAISQQAVSDIRARDLFGADLGVLIGGLGIILMGTMTGVITSLIAMQYLRNDDEAQSEMKENN